MPHNAAQSPQSMTFLLHILPLLEAVAQHCKALYSCETQVHDRSLWLGSRPNEGESKVQLTTHGICSGDAIQAPLGVVVKGMVALVQAAALPQGSQALLVFSTACSSCNADGVSTDCQP